LAKKPFSQSSTEAGSAILGTGKENVANNYCQSSLAACKEDETDIFGLDDVESNPKKRVLSDQEAVPLQSQEKRARNSSGEDDIFGFGKPTKPKVNKPFESSTQMPKSEKSSKQANDDDDDLFGFEEPKRSVKKSISMMQQSSSGSSGGSLSTEKNTTVNMTSRQDENQNTTAGSKVSNLSKLDSTGFLGKEDITVKSEVKTEYIEDTAGDISELSKSMVKVTLLNMFRPDTPKPAYVPSPNSDQLGKPVINYKKFKKQSLDKTRTVINLVKYVPTDLNQTGIDEWFNQNKDYTRREEEQVVIEKQSEDFWNFHNSQGQSQKRKKAPNPFSRR